MRVFSSLAAAGLIASMAISQTMTTVPAGLEKTEGNSYHWATLYYTNSRIQNIYGAKATGFKGPKVIKSISLRPDEKPIGKAFSAKMQVWLSSNGVAVRPVLYADWNMQHGKDKVVFMAKKTVNIPAVTGSTGPVPFHVTLKGDKPFVAIKPELCIDVAVYTPTSTKAVGTYVDANYSKTGTSGGSLTYGTPCNPTNFYNYARGFNEGNTLEVYGYSRNVGDFVFCWVGAGRANITLPWTGCTLYSKPIIMHPVPVKTTATSGLALFNWGKVPAGMKGVKVTSQMAAVDAKGTFRWSRGLEIKIGDQSWDYQSLYNYALGSITFNPDKDLGKYIATGKATIYGIQ